MYSRMETDDKPKGRTATQYNVRLDNELLARLRQEKINRGQSISDIIRLAIRKLLGMGNG